MPQANSSTSESKSMTKILETLSPPFRGGIYLLYRMLSAMRDGNEFLPSVPLSRVVAVVPAVVFGPSLTQSRRRNLFVFHEKLVVLLRCF